MSVEDLTRAKQFARRATKGSAPTASETEGVIVGTEGGPMLLLKGSSIPAPFKSTVGVNEGDRVMVRASDHSYTVTGNLTNPATDSATFARTVADIPAVNCIKQTDRGLLVGSTDENGKFVGSQTLLGDSLYFIGQDGTVLGEFSSDGIYIGGCEIAVTDEGELQGMNIYSSLGSVYISARKFPFATAGSSLCPTPPAINVTEDSVSVSVGYMRTDETGVIGAGAHSIIVSPDGIDLNGTVRANGKII